MEPTSPINKKREREGVDDEEPPKKVKISYFDKTNNILKSGITNLSLLIELGYCYKNYIDYEFDDYESDEEEYYDPLDDFKTNINLNKLIKILGDLDELNSMIGMFEIKETLLNQLLYFLQELNDKDDFLHSVIYGNPGVGKTCVAKIIANIYKNMGFLSRGFVKVATKDALVGQYIGETAIKTRKFLDSCIGGVMLLDEAYQLSSGSLDKADSYSKECIDIINQFLLEHRQNFICILAGYKTDIEKCFFALNKGLERRFQWRFEIKDYKSNELEQIFRNQVRNLNWKIDDKAIQQNFFEKNKEIFKNNGGDTEILLSKIKIAHSYRIVNCGTKDKKIINQEDVIKGFEIFKNTENIKKRLEKDNNSPPPFMYL